MIIKNIPKDALNLPYIIAIQQGREFIFMCATNNMESAKKLAHNIDGIVVSSKEIKQ